jgi:hypothetical protein
MTYMASIAIATRQKFREGRGAERMDDLPGRAVSRARHPVSEPFFFYLRAPVKLQICTTECRGVVEIDRDQVRCTVRK